MQDWNDLRFFLALARTGSGAAAARALGVNQTTVSRRIAELEQATGVQLFDRRPEGYRLRPDAAGLVRTAERMEAEAQAFADQAGALARGLEHIRVTTNEPLANVVLAPAVSAFRQQFPGVGIELVIGPRTLDLGRGEADVALRAGPALPDDPDLIARRVGEASWGIYCGHDYARFHAPPAGLEDLSGHTVMMVDDPGGRHIAAQAPAARALEPRPTLNDLCIAARAGLGVVSLPCVLGATQSDLRLCFVQPDYSTPIWLIWHRRLRTTPELRALIDGITAQATAARPILRGEQSLAEAAATSAPGR